jgi:hypothetical protein
MVRIKKSRLSAPTLGRPQTGCYDGNLPTVNRSTWREKAQDRGYEDDAIS